MTLVIMGKQYISVNEMVDYFNNCVVKPKKSKYHTLEDHNFHIRRYGRCVYCRLGSKPVPKSVILENMK